MRQKFQINQAASHRQVHPLRDRSFRSIRPPHTVKYIHSETEVSDQSGRLTPSSTSTQRQKFQINQAASHRQVHPLRDRSFRSIRPPHPITVHTATQRQKFQINQAASHHQVHPLRDRSFRSIRPPHQSQYIHPLRDRSFRSIRPPHTVKYIHSETEVSDQSGRLTPSSTSTQRQKFQINQAASHRQVTVHTFRLTHREFQINQAASSNHSTYSHSETEVSNQSGRLTPSSASISSNTRISDQSDRLTNHSTYIHLRDKRLRSITPSHLITVHPFTQRQKFQIN